MGEVLSQQQQLGKNMSLLPRSVCVQGAVLIALIILKRLEGIHK